MQDTSVSFGYQLDVPKANLQFKGTACINTFIATVIIMPILYYLPDMLVIDNRGKSKRLPLVKVLSWWICSNVRFLCIPIVFIHPSKTHWVNCCLKSWFQPALHHYKVGSKCKWTKLNLGCCWTTDFTFTTYAFLCARLHGDKEYRSRTERRRLIKLRSNCNEALLIKYEPRYCYCITCFLPKMLETHFSALLSCIQLSSRPPYSFLFQNGQD